MELTYVTQSWNRVENFDRWPAPIRPGSLLPANSNRPDRRTSRNTECLLLYCRESDRLIQWPVQLWRNEPYSRLQKLIAVARSAWRRQQRQQHSAGSTWNQLASCCLRSRPPCRWCWSTMRQRSVDVSLQSEPPATPNTTSITSARTLCFHFVLLVRFFVCPLSTSCKKLYTLSKMRRRFWTLQSEKPLTDICIISETYSASQAGIIFHLTLLSKWVSLNICSRRRIRKNSHSGAGRTVH